MSHIMIDQNELVTLLGEFGTMRAKVLAMDSGLVLMQLLPGTIDTSDTVNPAGEPMKPLSGFNGAARHQRYD